MIEKYMEIDVSLLKKAKWNYKTDDEAKKEKLKENIKTNGQLENIIVREMGKKYEVVNGNHRLDCFIELKMKKIVCCNVGKITQAHAEKIAIETNETKFDTDDILFAESIARIRKEFDASELSKTMPLDEAEIEKFSELLKFDWSQFDKPDEAANEGYTRISLNVPDDIFDLWTKWQERCRELLGYDKPEKCFEFAVVEAINIPVKSLK